MTPRQLVRNITQDGDRSIRGIGPPVLVTLGNSKQSIEQVQQSKLLLCLIVQAKDIYVSLCDRGMIDICVSRTG